MNGVVRPIHVWPFRASRNRYNNHLKRIPPIALYRIVSCISLVLVGAAIGCVSLDDNARGVKDAKKRIQKGELVKTMPMGFYSFSDETPEYWRILREQYGISHEMTMGKSEEHVQGFDSVMKPEIVR